MSVAFGADENTAITGSLDSSIKVWSIKNGINLMTMYITKPYEGMNITDVDGLTQARQEKLFTLGAITTN